MSIDNNKDDEIIIKGSELIAFQKQFGLKIKIIRLSKGMSQLELALLIGFEKTTISRIENGRTNFTLLTALKLSLALETDLSDLFNFKITNVS